MLVGPSSFVPGPTAVRIAGDGPPASATVGWNTVREFQEAGVAAFGEHTKATVKRNSIHFGHDGGTCPTSGTSTSGSGASTPAGISPNCFAFGIWFDGLARGTASGNVVVSDAVHFVIENGAVRPGSAGVAAIPSGSVGAPVLFGGIMTGLISQTLRVDVLDNQIVAAFVGITVADDGSHVVGNSVFATPQAGILLQADNSDVRRNTIELTGTGISVDDRSTDNVFRHNTVSDNINNACDDSSSGSGTAGTANTWTGNTGTPSNPLGICDAPAP